MHSTMLFGKLNGIKLHIEISADDTWTTCMLFLHHTKCNTLMHVYYLVHTQLYIEIVPPQC